MENPLSILLDEVSEEHAEKLKELRASIFTTNMDLLMMDVLFIRMAHLELELKKDDVFSNVSLIRKPAIMKIVELYYDIKSFSTATSLSAERRNPRASANIVKMW